MRVGERGAEIQSHAVSLSLIEMKSIWLALSVAHLSPVDFEQETREGWANLYERFKTLIQRIDVIERSRAHLSSPAMTLAWKPPYFCITENCPAPVGGPGKHCRDCSGGAV